ncbi:hypothetical protein KJ359_001521 [Pestalotiopsis sp. 9143b]|nr:hypothetical protein KJ359_001521 [Pestalotiopsis sp. 9143b]
MSLYNLITDISVGAVAIHNMAVLASLSQAYYRQYRQQKYFLVESQPETPYGFLGPNQPPHFPTTPSRETLSGDDEARDADPDFFPEPPTPSPVTPWYEAHAGGDYFEALPPGPEVQSYQTHDPSMGGSFVTASGLFCRCVGSGVVTVGVADASDSESD